ncbi:NUDIX domain-containing protein, partial [Bifidobacterium longum]
RFQSRFVLFGDRKSYTGHGPCLYLRPSTNLRKISGVIETPEQTALREFHEETGLHVDADSAAVLQRMHADTGVMKDSIAVVGLNVSEVTPDAGRDWELSHLTWCSVQTMDQMIAAGSIADGITLAAYTIWRLRGRA